MSVPPDLLAFQTTLELPPGETLETLLGRFVDYMAPAVSPDLEVHRDVVIAERAGWDLRCHVVRDPTVPDPDVLVWYHGGAFVVGNADTHLELASQLARCGCTVVVVDYRRAPRHPFPAAFDDAATALAWVAARVGSTDGLPGTTGASRVFVGGDSAGGNLALAVAVDPAVDVEVAGCVLAYGVYDYFRAAPQLDRLVVDEHGVPRRYVAGGPEMLSGDPRLVPEVRAQHAPPCLVIGATRDPLNAESEALLAALEQSGVPHRAYVPDVGHGFLQNPGMAERDEAFEHIRRFRRGGIMYD